MEKSLLKVTHSVLELIGRTPLLKLKTLSQMTGSEIWVKCEHLNPGGSIKDRASLKMVQMAIERGDLKKGQTIIEGTAGNTGIGLSLVAKALGYKMHVVMPNNQSPEKEKVLDLYGAAVQKVPPVPFANEGHFYKTAQKIALENPSQYWMPDQFNNLDNYRAHYENTAPEIYAQVDGKLDYLVSVSGSSGTIAGCSAFLKEKIAGLKAVLVDPMGSGLCHYFYHKEFKMVGSSITEGIGIMRLVENYKQAKIDEAFTLPDLDLVTVAYYLREHEGLCVGTSSALNIAGALKVAARAGPGKRIVTFVCDGGERASTRLWNHEFLKAQSLTSALDQPDFGLKDLIERYRSET
jgi:cysteine synthase A